MLPKAVAGYSRRIYINFKRILGLLPQDTSGYTFSVEADTLSSSLKATSSVAAGHSNRKFVYAGSWRLVQLVYDFSMFKYLDIF